MLKQRGSLFSTVFKYTTKPYLVKLGYPLEGKVFFKNSFPNMLIWALSKAEAKVFKINVWLL